MSPKLAINAVFFRSAFFTMINRPFFILRKNLKMKEAQLHCRVRVTELPKKISHYSLLFQFPQVGIYYVSTPYHTT